MIGVSASLRRALAKIRQLGLMTVLLTVTLSPHHVFAADILNALGRTNYTMFSADVNGDGRVDFLVKANPNIVLIPLDDDLQIPISIAPEASTFVLLSDAASGYQLLANPDSAILNAAWGRADYSLAYSRADGSLSMTPKTTAQPRFTVMMSSTGSLVLTGYTPGEPGSSTPTISAMRTPAAMTAGQSYTVSWSSTNATSVTRICSASGTGYTGNQVLPANGSTTGTAAPEWVGFPSSCAWTADGPGGSATFNETMVTNTSSDVTINVSRNPATMTAGQPYSLSWSTANATTVSRVCTASGTGYTISDAPGASGTATGTAAAAWVNNPSTCTWKASGPGGSATFIENMVTRAAVVGDGVTYIHTDGLGSPVARTDSAGNIVSRTRYEPYGLTAGGATPTIGFTGHVNDADTGLVYMQQRYYDPVAGRFLSIDPVTTDADTGGSFNRYAYAENNPYKYVDPDGRSVIAAAYTGGAVLVIGAYKYATDPAARAVINRIVQAVANKISGTPAASSSEGKKDTLQPGEHAGESVPARGPDRDFTQGERDKINEIGGTSGCHTCGATDAGTSSGNFIPDHQPPNALNPTGGAQELYPHCLNCSRTQGGQVRGEQTRKPKPPEPKKPEPAKN
jgi:RHS repeat-associated protein